MHVSGSDGHAVTGIEVVACAKTHHESKGEILPLRVLDTMRSPRVNESGSTTQLKVGCCPPVTMDKITPHAQIESPISCFRSPRNRCEGQGHCKMGFPPPPKWLERTGHCKDGVAA